MEIERSITLLICNYLFILMYNSVYIAWICNGISRKLDLPGHKTASVNCPIFDPLKMRDYAWNSFFFFNTLMFAKHLELKQLKQEAVFIVSF